MNQVGKLKLMTGNANRTLAQAIARCLEIDLSAATVDSFNDGETRVKIDDDVRGADMFVIQPLVNPANQYAMELFIMLDALRRASIERITAVLPYFGYARQDRKDQPRVPITAKLMANLIATAGADRVLTLDLHAHQIQGFFDIPLDHLYAVNIFVDHIRAQNFAHDIVVVSPDAGGAKMARGYASRLEADLAIIDKRRISDRDTEVMNILGEVKGKIAVVVDDICATAGSLVEAAAALKKAGAVDVYATITHPVLAGPAIERIDKSDINKIWVTDSIQLHSDKRHPKIEVLSSAELIGEAIKRIHYAQSISSLFR